MDDKFMLESERLLLYPIGDGQMRALIEGETDPALRQAYGEMLEGCLREPEKRIWHAVWFLELKERPGTVAGDLSFKGLGADGTVELGYGLREGYCGKGYMTEAVRAVSAWALRQQGVRRVEAETEADNLASRAVLARSGYLPTGLQGEEGPRFVYCGDEERIPAEFARRAGPARERIAFCGLDCERCEARIATLTDDEALLKRTAALWSKLNGVTITPEALRCEGCRADGVKTLYCEALCPIRQCALGRGLETCGGCGEMERCEKLGAILHGRPYARRNLQEHSG